MANIQNLKPVRTKKEARERGRAGGIKSGQVRKERKTLKEELLLLLASDDNNSKISTALIKRALNGDVSAFAMIRDTIGEKPNDKLELSNDKPFEVNIKVVK